MSSPSVRGWSLPRLTARVFDDLAVWMIGLGLLIGAIFPFVIIPLGVPAAQTLRPGFFAATLTAGLIVGAANVALARGVVGGGLHGMAERMRYVADVIGEATYTDDWRRCSPDECELTVDSDDQLGHAAQSFNQLLHALARSRRIEQAMAGYTRAMASHLEIDTLCTAALEGLVEHSGADAGALCVVREGVPRIEAVHRLDPNGLLASATVREALAAGQVTVLEVADEVTIDAAVVSFRPSAVVVAPIRVTDLPVAAVVLAFGRFPTPERLRLLENLCGPTGVALTNALAHERFQRLAAIDSLTGVYNRRFGMGRLQEEFSRATRSGTPLGVLLLDLDHFKEVNDGHGHLVGDQLLREVAATVRRVLREGDVLVRTGGEEFLVLLPGADSEDTRAVGERVRCAVAAAAVAVRDQAVSVTTSLGGLVYPATSVSSLDELLDRADHALYRSKGDGRDRLTMCLADRDLPTVA